MASRYLVFAAAGLWLALVIMSFAAADPAGDAFTRGLDRAGVLLAWQGGAMAAAVTALAAMLRQREPRGVAVSLAGIGPLVVMAIELVLAVALVFWLATRDPHERIERFYYPSSAYSGSGQALR